VLRIDVENFARYDNDVTDFSKLATIQAPTPPVPAVNFASYNSIGDIVAVNGTRVRGTLLLMGRQFQFNSNPVPGQIHGDSRGSPLYQGFIDILHADGSVIGSIATMGFANGPPAPGAPADLVAGRGAVVGGSGAFFGVRGQEGLARAAGGAGRRASVAEDPSLRRTYGGSSIQVVLHVIPMEWPEVVMAGGSPAIVHSNDFSPVTRARPATAGEAVTLFATGLGPTRPGVDPGEPFTADLPQLVNSPLEVKINGQRADVLYAGGYPGTTNTYQVNFRIPPGLTSGQATLQITAAWISGPEAGTWIQ
jgi:hypothetical protein